MTAEHKINTADQKFGISKIFNDFFKEVSSAHQGCIYLIKAEFSASLLITVFSV